MIRAFFIGAELLKLYAFDIDGTLISMSGAGGRAFKRGLVKTFGTAGKIGSYSFAGKTDPQIVFELMRSAGVSDSDIKAKINEFFACYTEIIKEEVVTEPRPVVLPGVLELLESLDRDSESYSILVTGNIKEGGYVKLKALGLDRFFATGSFGSDSIIRNELPEIGFHRAEKIFGVSFRKKDMLVIGDTPADIECAKAFGVKSVAVATGFHSMSELESFSPDLVLSSFENMNDSLRKMEDLLQS